MDSHSYFTSAQCVLSSRNDTKFQHLALVRKAIIDEIRQNATTYDSKSIDQAEALLKAMVLILYFGTQSLYHFAFNRLIRL